MENSIALSGMSQQIYGYIVIDNYTELKKLDKLASSKKKHVKTLIRINPGIEAHTHEYVKTSKTDSKFGINIEGNDAEKFIVKT